MSQSSNPAETTELPKQFLVTREQLIPKSGWRHVKLGDYYLHLGAGVGATRVSEQENGLRRETLVLGWFGYRDNFYPRSGTSELKIEGRVEDIYPEMTGRFVMLTWENGRLLCTADAGAQFPVVYREETAELGSTPMVLGWTKALEKEPVLFEAFSRADRTLWFPFGVTPYVGVERLLPQQTIALQKDRATPVERQSFQARLLDVPQMHRMAYQFIQSLCGSQVTVECHLTAGWDSRMVLSASLPAKDSIDYLTYLAEGNTARIDAEVANHIAAVFGLRYRQVPVAEPSKDEIDRWLKRTSECVIDSVTGLTRTIVDDYTDRYGLAGVGGEVGRAFYWKKSDIGPTGLSPEQLLQRLGFDNTSVALQRADRWLATYRHESRTRILDRAYIDIRLGCWAGPSLGGHLVEKPTLSPFNSLNVYESMVALPERYRLSGRFARDFISQGSAKLARIPVNRLQGTRRLGNLHREFAKMLPKSAKARIRQHLMPRAHA
jgi:hypothetical protein